jgi:hypothetical protein
MPAVRSSQRPLGLKADFRVSNSVLETLRFIEAFDVEAVDRKTRSARLPFGGAMLEFKRFLALPLLYPGRQEFPFVPSLRLDALWHAFILNTPRYREFCERVYGQYLDHLPAKSRKETERRVFRGPMQFTVESISRAFDNVNKYYWNKIAFCGPCLIFKN